MALRNAETWLRNNQEPKVEPRKAPEPEGPSRKPALSNASGVDRSTHRVREVEGQPEPSPEPPTQPKLFP